MIINITIDTESSDIKTAIEKNHHWVLLAIANKWKEQAAEITRAAAELDKIAIDIWDVMTPDADKRHAKPNHE